jgi:hypothetical protein
MPVKPVTTDPIEKQFVSSWRHLNRQRRKQGQPEMTLQEYMAAQYAGTVGRWSPDRKTACESKPKKPKRKRQQNEFLDDLEYESLNRSRVAKGLPPISKETYRKNWKENAE